jgi:3-hydroxyisobutyrate dehydrogenase
MKVKADAIAATLAGEDKVPATFDIDSMRKDLQLMLAEAQSGAFPLPVVDTVLRSMDEASAAGWGKRDCAWMPAFWAAKASKHAVSQAS